MTFARVARVVFIAIPTPIAIALLALSLTSATTTTSPPRDASDPRLIFTDYIRLSSNIYDAYSTQMIEFGKLFAVPVFEDQAWRQKVTRAASDVKDRLSEFRRLPMPTIGQACFDPLAQRLNNATLLMDETMSLVIVAMASGGPEGLVPVVPKLDAANEAMTSVNQEIMGERCSG